MPTSAPLARPRRRLPPEPLPALPADRTIENPLSGERLTFLKTADETSGRYLLLDIAMRPGGAVGFTHLHLRQDEHFEVRTGQIWLQHGDCIRLLLPGETYTVPAGTPHTWWNPGTDEAVVRLTFEPALEMEHFFRTYFGLVRDGRVMAGGRMHPLQAALVFRAYHLYAAEVPIAWQRLIYTLLAPLAWLRGYRARYTRYGPARAEHSPRTLTHRIMNTRYLRTPRTLLLAGLLLGLAALSACREPAATDLAAADASLIPSVQATSDIAAGRYIVQIAGCNDCHTAGFMEPGGTSIPESQRLLGDSIGFRGPWGTTYPKNLRLTVQQLSEDAWVQTLRTRQALPPMPWPSVNAMSEQDARAVYRYIRSLGPAGAPAPVPVPPGQEPATPYIDFMPQLPAGHAAPSTNAAPAPVGN